jgi:hypothetical protein
MGARAGRTRNDEHKTGTESGPPGFRPRRQSSAGASPAASCSMRYARGFRLAGWLLTLAGIAYVALGASDLANRRGSTWPAFLLGLVAIVVGTALIRWSRRNLTP